MHINSLPVLMRSQSLYHRPLSFKTLNFSLAMSCWLLGHILVVVKCMEAARQYSCTLRQSGARTPLEYVKDKYFFCCYISCLWCAITCCLVHFLIVLDLSCLLIIRWSLSFSSWSSPMIWNQTIIKKNQISSIRTMEYWTIGIILVYGAV